jgi:hypothetical protein
MLQVVSRFHVSLDHMRPFKISLIAFLLINSVRTSELEDLPCDFDASGIADSICV